MADIEAFKQALAASGPGDVIPVNSKEELAYVQSSTPAAPSTGRGVDGTAVPPVVTELADKINHPDHYTRGQEVYPFVQSWRMSFAEGNVIKYVTRAPHKGKRVDDLKKARWYLDRLIEEAEADAGSEQ